LTIPTIVNAPTAAAASASVAATPIPPHFKKPFLTRQARTPNQISDAATAISAASMMIFCISLLVEWFAEILAGFESRASVAAADLETSAAEFAVSHARGELSVWRPSTRVDPTIRVPNFSATAASSLQPFVLVSSSTRSSFG
jgi:hypothetical protein